jgi:hypothetical protein
MKKFGYVLAALATFAIAAPSIASAETIVIKRGGNHDGWRGARAEHRDHGWHRGWNRGYHRGADKVVIIKKQRRHDW